MTRWIGGAGILFALWVSPSAAANELRNALDASLASGDPQQLVAIMRDHQNPADQVQIVRWLKDKVDTGQAPDKFAQVMVLQSLSEKNIPDAAMYLSYYRALVWIDSSICPDPSSGASLLEGTIFLFGRLSHAPSLTEDQKRSAVDRALKLEETTSAVRKIDSSLCGAGLTGYAKDLNLTLSAPKGYDAITAAPSTGLYKDDPVWIKKRREIILPQLQATLLSLIGVQSSP